MISSQEYATTLLELADEKDATLRISGDLELILKKYAEEKKIFKSEESVQKEFFKKMDNVMVSFLSVLVKNKDVDKLPIIAAYFWKISFKIERGTFQQVIVRSAVPLSPEQRAKIAKRLVERLDKELSIKYVIDPGILGGIIVRAGDFYFNNSLKKKISLLKHDLVKKEHYY
ncbi:MAG: hypothetical protein ACD_63C00077G0003 [uncultured bacterium]|nr:MAG: hypothetical protein ACD_63C00077G0003 [uncultured bacterium]